MTVTTHPLPLWTDVDPSGDIAQWLGSFSEPREASPGTRGGGPGPGPGSRAGVIDALYVHVPFCFHKCHYCDFYSIVDTPGAGLGREDDRQFAFTRRLISEMELRAGQTCLRPTTIFVGGGTPTLLRPELWSRVLSRMRALGVLERVEEFTVEANPETVTSELLGVLVAGGVNRMSIGAQSFDPGLLKTLERWHDPAAVPRAVALARAAGINNINLDLIFGIPGQGLEQLDADLDAALALEPQHLSCYGLTFEPNTALSQRREMGRVEPVDEDLEREMYERVMDRLSQVGYEHYEVSNWARPGQWCRHNLVYWRNGDWLGLGPGAASHVGGRRWKNVAHLGRYIDEPGQPPMCDHEYLSVPRRIGEQLMLGLRLLEGVSWRWLTDALPAADPRWSSIGELLSRGLLAREGENLCLTRQGLFLADGVLEMLI